MVQEPRKHTIEESVATTIISQRFNCVVWGAIIAGVIMIIVVQLFMALLGSGFGLTTVNVREEDNLKALGVGAVVWWIISGIIAYYIGGWVTGRMAGIPRRLDGVLHGLLAWGSTTILTFLFLTSTMGALIAGSLGLLKSGGQAVSSVAPAVSGTLKEALPLDDIRNEVRHQLQQRNGSQNMVEPVMTAIAGLATTNNEEEQKQKIVLLLMQNTNLNENEARNLVDRWGQNMETTKQKAQDAAQTASKTAGKAALASFVMLALGALAAGIGGSVGAPHWSEQEIA